MKVFLISAMALMAVSACASRETPPDDASQGSLAGNAGAAAGSATAQTRDGFADAALTPLEDFNLRRRQIPPLLAQMDSPYDAATELDCGQIAAMIAELDQVLGSDWDAPEPDERLRTEILADEAADATLGVVRSGATGWIPFRGLIRKATGAESHETKYNRAYKIGAQKRAYLKGYGLARDCDVPARPDFATLLTQDIDAIIYKHDTPETPPD